MARSHLKAYFAVDTSYVLRKLMIILLPFSHKNWSPQYQQQERAFPSQDINSPDLYIPGKGWHQFGWGGAGVYMAISTFFFLFFITIE